LGDFACIFGDFNYPFLTPQKQKTEFRKQETEVLRKRGVRNR